jgi:hypothetical protein
MLLVLQRPRRRGIASPQQRLQYAEYEVSPRLRADPRVQVVRDSAGTLPEGTRTLRTPVQAAARFQIPEYLLRKACLEGRLEHLRVVNAIWLSPPAVAPFACSWRAQEQRNP